MSPYPICAKAQLTTFLGTATAGFGAALAVIGLVLLALSTAGVTDFCTKTAQVSGEP
jgi:hypothetical protein